MRSIFVTLALTLTQLAHATSEPCSHRPFGDMGYFNLFLFGDLTHHDTDTEGRIAAQGNITLSHYSVGKKVNPSDGGAHFNLIAGRMLKFTDGTVWNGFSLYGTSLAFLRVGQTQHANIVLPYPYLLTGEAIAVRGSRVDFAAAARIIERLDAVFGSLRSNGSVETVKGDLYLRAFADSRNVFDVSAEQLDAAGAISIEAPETSTVLVRISGKSLRMRDKGFRIKSVRAGSVVFFAPQALSIELAGIALPAHLIAGRAAISFTNGRIDGTVIGHSLVGDGQLNRVAFNGCLPN